MKLFLITQSVNDNYDTYDSMVVVAEDMDDAKNFTGEKHHSSRMYSSWADFKDLQGEEIGIADPKYKKMEIICASFNAG